jgi:hypothetical protein
MKEFSAIQFCNIVKNNLEQDWEYTLNQQIGNSSVYSFVSKRDMQDNPLYLSLVPETDNPSMIFRMFSFCYSYKI